MTSLNEKYILDFPDEVIEEIMAFLSYSDYFNLSKVDKRLQDCAERVLKKKPFSKYIIKSFILSYRIFDIFIDTKIFRLLQFFNF